MSQPDADFPGGGDTTTARYHANARSVVVAYLLWFFLGWLGIHRFYLGRVASGIIMLLLWGAGTGLAVVLIGYLLLIPGMVRAENNAVVDRIARGH